MAVLGSAPLLGTLNSQSQELRLSTGRVERGLQRPPTQKPLPVLLSLKPAPHLALGFSELPLQPFQVLPLRMNLKHPVFGSQNPALP